MAIPSKQCTLLHTIYNTGHRRAATPLHSLAVAVAGDGAQPGPAKSAQTSSVSFWRGPAVAVEWNAESKSGGVEGEAAESSSGSNEEINLTKYRDSGRLRDSAMNR